MSYMAVDLNVLGAFIEDIVMSNIEHYDYHNKEKWQ